MASALVRDKDLTTESETIGRMGSTPRPMSATFETVLKQVRTAEARLAAFDAKLDNPRFFRPVIKAEWDRAFVRREVLKTQLCRIDCVRFGEVYPDEPNNRHL